MTERRAELFVEPDAPKPAALDFPDVGPYGGRRCEIIDGALYVSPAPSRNHQRAVVRLIAKLEAACPSGIEVLVAPVDYRPTPEHLLQADVIICHPDDHDPRYAVKPLLLAVEILSPSTRMLDLLLKRGVYEQAGVRSYWILDPEKETLTVLELVDGVYVERDVVSGEKVYDATLPFPVRIAPAELLRSR
ncbi:Uma2 family endonuclease [Kribbella sp. NPDC050124]|uniref:Uma2 family endonuclease n=1 Tax=Kribbella sp. NPDC050124 TaxID=3364114 RepID=UPI003787C753